MVKNKQELLSMAAEWTRHAANDLREQLIRFMERVGADNQRVSDVLGLTNGEIDQILNGDGNISISTFAKLLIATGNILEIKPVSAAPRGAFGAPRGQRPPHGGRMGGAPRHGSAPSGFPTPPMPPVGPLASYPGDMHQMPMGGRPQMPMGGQMQGREINLDDLSRNELINIVRQEGLEGSIDVMRATRGQIIDLLESHQRETMPSVQVRGQRGGNHGVPTNVPMAAEMPQAEEPQFEEEQGGGEHSDEELASMLLSELANNPNLRNIVSRFMGGERN